MGDSSVHFFSQNVQVQVIYRLIACRDGVPVQLP
jgi:hypothetical protein